MAARAVILATICAVSLDAQENREVFCEAPQSCTSSVLGLVFGNDVDGESSFVGPLLPGTEVRTTVVLETLEGPVFGWSYALQHDPAILLAGGLRSSAASIHSSAPAVGPSRFSDSQALRVAALRPRSSSSINLFGVPVSSLGLPDRSRAAGQHAADHLALWVVVGHLWIAAVVETSVLKQQ